MRREGKKWKMTTAMEKENGKGLQKHKENNMIKIGTWNIISINGKQEEIIWEMKEFKIQILGLSEIKMKESGIKLLQYGYTLYYSGLEHTDGNKERTKEGVGIILTEELNQKVIGWKNINSKIMYVQLKMEITLTIFQIYTPIQGTDKNKMEEFYNTLQETINEVTEDCNGIMILGDWNGRIGKDIRRGLGCMGKFGEEEINSNGKLMINFCVENDLKIGNTFCEYELEDRYTYEAEEMGGKSIIDYIVYTQDIEQMVVNVKVEREAELNTRHSLVVAKLNIQVPENVEKKD